MKHTVALFGANGRMGFRAANSKLVSSPDFDVLLVEKDAESAARLEKLGRAVTPADEALAVSDLVILAVPDLLIGSVANEVAPKMKPGAAIVFFDAVSAYMGQVDYLDGIGYYMVHPCHPAMFSKQPSLEAYADVYGSKAGVQDVLTCRIRGDAETYETVKAMARLIFDPVGKCFEATLEQMVYLEPTLAETATGTMSLILRRCFEHAREMGLDDEAARSIILGHVQTMLAGIAGVLKDNPSDAARVAMSHGISYMLRPDWEKVFTMADTRRVADKMLTNAYSKMIPWEHFFDTDNVKIMFENAEKEPI